MPLPQPIFVQKPAKPGAPPTIAADGSVEGCSIIYAPKGQAAEYAPLAVNLYRGCGHQCAYCYVPLITKSDRAVFDQGAVIRGDILDKLRRDAVKYQAAWVKSQIMFSFTTDPYPPQHHKATRMALQILAEHDLAFCTLTKGGTRALRDIDLFDPKKDAFASTMTSLDDDFSRKWEAGAALPGDRIKALRTFHDKGIFTWVSLEPTINVEASLKILQETHEFVDLYKIGRVNYMGITQTTDWKGYTLKMIELVQKLGVKHYFKRDLQKYLPEGYYNPLRVPQHN